MILRSTYCFLLLLGSFSGRNAGAQILDMNRAVAENAEWNKGTITLTSGETLSGDIKLNTKTGLLTFENGAISKTFTARNVLGFSYFDAAEEKRRNFLSIEYKQTRPKNDKPLAVMNNQKREKSTSEMATPIFCEIRVECKTFALLSTVGQMNVTQIKLDPGSVLAPTPPSTTYSQTETLLILDEAGLVTPILEVTRAETDRLLIDEKQTKNKKRDKTALEEYTGVYYEQLEAYAKERKLSFRKIENVIEIVEYYKSLEAD